MKAAWAVVFPVLGVSCLAPSGASRTNPPLRPSTTAVAPTPAQPAPLEPKQVATTPAIPGTPAGHTLQTWLDVFNCGDAQRQQAFAAAYELPERVLDLPSLYRQTGGFDLLAIQKSTRLQVVFLVQEKASPTRGLGWIKVKDADPVSIETFALRAIPPGTPVAEVDVSLDAATRGRVIDAVVAKLGEFYVYPEVAQQMELALRERQKKSEYEAVDNGLALAAMLTEQLQAVSHDRHLRVDFSPRVLPPGDPEPSAEDKARMREQLERVNCGFEKAEKLDGNIGYVKFNMFGDPEVCGPKATAALGSLAGVDALVFDLRDNGGGAPSMVAFVASYLFDQRTHLNDIYNRKENATIEHWTRPDVPGQKFVNQPVFVLTSARTFSGAEEFCYDLATLKRATIVGETTGGGAHPTALKRLEDHFALAVPFARAINPITRTNWEGKGIAPDVRVPANQALDAATKLALQWIDEHKHRPQAGKRKGH